MVYRRYWRGTKAPEKTWGAHDWNVYCEDGALQVLNTGEFREYFEYHPEKAYVISFADNSFADIKEDDPLWKKLDQMAKHYTVKVFPTEFPPFEYTEWPKPKNDRRNFNAIWISLKKPAE
jgi:hypothetical protein